MAQIINLDAGHGINTAGKRSPDGVREWTLNNAVVLALAKLLGTYDCTVYRLDDPTGQSDVGINSRRDKAVKNGGVIISIHHNAFEGKWGTHTGTETWYGLPSKVNARSMELAEVIQGYMARIVPLKSRGVKSSDNYGIIRTTAIPAVLVEGGFYDSTIDFPVINSAEGQQKYAQAVCDGLVSFMGLKKKDEGTVAPEPPPTPPTPPVTGSEFKVGDAVIVNGYPCINSNGEHPGKLLSNYSGKVTKVNVTGANRFHIDTKGWCREEDINLQGSVSSPSVTKKILLNSGTWNIRNAPGMQNKTMSTIKGGVEISYTAISDGWYKIDGGYIGPAAVKKVIN